MMTSYYSENELEAAEKVSDKELNELLQEVRTRDNRYYLLEKKHTIKRWCKKTIEKTYYTLLFKVSIGEYQVINFCQDHEWSINCAVSKSYIYTLLSGWLNGYDYGLTKYKNIKEN